MKLVIMLSVLLFGCAHLVLAGGDGISDFMKMPPIDPKSGLLEVDARAVFSEAKEIVKTVELGKPHTIWLLPRVTNPSPHDPFGSGAVGSGVVQIDEVTLGRLSKEDALHFVAALKAPLMMTAHDAGCLWTWVPLMSDKPSSSDLGDLEFRFMGDRFCWRVHTTRPTGGSPWADLIYSREFALWVKKRMGKVPAHGA